MFRLRRRAPLDAERTISAQMRNALHLVLAGDLAAAEVVLAEAARIDSSSSDVYLALANVYRARGDIGRAIQIHQNLLLRQDLPEELRREALLGLALDFRAGGFLARAAASFQELLQVEPRNLQALRELERIHVESGDWEAAIRMRRRIGSRDPNSSRVLGHLWAALGRQHVSSGDEAEARKAFRRALGQDSDCAEAYIGLGDQQLRAGKPKRALEHYRRTLDLHPAIGVLVYPKLREAYAQAGDLAAFEDLLRERHEADRDDREAGLCLASVSIEQGRVDEGIGLFRRLANRSPEYMSAYVEMARALLNENRDAEALKAFEELLTHLPPEPLRLHCESCGALSAELHWRCPHCGAWDSIA